MKIVQINTSVRSTGSQSSALADAVTLQLRAKYPDAVVSVRDLAATPHPILDEASLKALSTPADQRSPAQAARVALDDALIAELLAADILVFGAPMYNFGVTVQLKSWFDAVARAGTTFAYTAQGPQGLVNGKKVFVATTRGGVHRDQPRDHHAPHIKTFLGFLGITDVHFIYAEGLAMGPDAAAQSLSAAQVQIEAALA